MNYRIRVVRKISGYIAETFGLGRRSLSEKAVN
jgi:hypothetical protein